ncbi:MAG: hypothetical protein OXE99_14750 [Cellvibrionales bacterium]|nr:hypothetical protein [Cellvibrionales bacterium]
MSIGNPYFPYFIIGQLPYYWSATLLLVSYLSTGNLLAIGGSAIVVLVSVLWAYVFKAV